MNRRRKIKHARGGERQDEDGKEVQSRGSRERVGVTGENHIQSWWKKQVEELMLDKKKSRKNAEGQKNRRWKDSFVTSYDQCR